MNGKMSPQIPLFHYEKPFCAMEIFNPIKPANF